jgi:hypothetical protein
VLYRFLAPPVQEHELSIGFQLADECALESSMSTICTTVQYIWYDNGLVRPCWKELVQVTTGTNGDEAEGAILLRSRHRCPMLRLRRPRGHRPCSPQASTQSAGQ